MITEDYPRRQGTTATEDYVSFETAKLLKEKGFDEKCTHYYKNEKYLVDLGYTNIHFCANSDLVEEFAAPTLQMAMKWLRIEHNLCIVPLPVVTDDDGEGGCLWKYTISMKLKVLFDSENLYESTEIALDDAIKRCLENLKTFTSRNMQ